MGCLTKYVSYKKSCLVESGGTAKYLVQNLPAISTKMAAGVANSDQISGANLIEEALQFNENILADRIKDAFRSLTIIDKIMSQCACVAPPDMAGVTFSTKAHAFGIQMVFHNPSKFGFYHIDQLRILTNNTASNVVLTFEELVHNPITNITAIETETYTVPNITGSTHNIVTVDYRVKTNKLKIYATGLNLAQFACFAESSKSCGCSGSKPQNTASDLQDQYFQIFEYDSLTPSVFNQDGKVQGIQPCVSYKCDVELLMCAYASYFASTFLYMVGSYILERSLTDERFNPFTLLNYEQRIGAAEQYSKTANMYFDINTKSIEQTLRTMKGDNCLMCKGVQTAYVL